MCMLSPSDTTSSAQLHASTDDDARRVPDSGFQSGVAARPDSDVLRSYSIWASVGLGTTFIPLSSVELSKPETYICARHQENDP